MGARGYMDVALKLGRSDGRFGATSKRAFANCDCIQPAFLQRSTAVFLTLTHTAFHLMFIYCGSLPGLRIRFLSCLNPKFGPPKPSKPCVVSLNNNNNTDAPPTVDATKMGGSGATQHWAPLPPPLPPWTRCLRGAYTAPAPCPRQLRAGPAHRAQPCLPVTPQPPRSGA